MNSVRIVLLTALASFVLACGPIVMIPGGELSGSPQSHPGNWAFTDAVETVQLETNPDDPYSVNIWGISGGEHFYVAGSKESQWTQNASADPRVRLRVEDNLYDLTAAVVDDDAEIEVFANGARTKYDWEPEPDQRSGAIVFRLEPR